MKKQEREYFVVVVIHTAVSQVCSLCQSVVPRIHSEDHIGSIQTLEEPVRLLVSDQSLVITVLVVEAVGNLELDLMLDLVLVRPYSLDLVPRMAVFD